MGKLSYLKDREEMVEIALEMWDRRLTNAAGGNFAVRVEENKILITPSMMAEHHRCKMDPKDILVIDFDMNILEGVGKLSRESKMHVLILKGFENIKATIHAHPMFSMVFAAQSKPIPNITEATMKRGPAECSVYATAHTPGLADNIYRYFDERRELANQYPIACVMPLHGIIVSGKSLSAAFSMLERIESDAICNIFKDKV